MPVVGQARPDVMPQLGEPLDPRAHDRHSQIDDRLVIQREVRHSRQNGRPHSSQRSVAAALRWVVQRRDVELSRLVAIGISSAPTIGRLC